MTAFGDWLRTHLDARGWTQSDLARAMSARPSNISRWLTGRQTPTPAQCAKIAHALGLPASTVLIAAGHLTADDPATDRAERITEAYATIARLRRDLDALHDTLARLS